MFSAGGAVHPGPHGLTFTWWGCCGSCQRHTPTEFARFFCYSVLVSISVFIFLSIVFHSINSPDNSLLSHSVLPVVILGYWSFQLYTASLCESLHQPWYNQLWLTGLKAPTNELYIQTHLQDWSTVQTSWSVLTYPQVVGGVACCLTCKFRPLSFRPMVVYIQTYPQL